MTLKEKFQNITWAYPADESVKIADDYAIEFSEWIEEYQGGTPNSKILKELLEIFKKEKGL